MARFSQSPSQVACRLALFFACLACLVHLSGARASAADTPAAGEPPKFVVIPVLYLTDRDWIASDETFGPNRKYVVNCLHDMYYGISYMPVRNSKGKRPDANFARLGWTTSDKVKERICKKDCIDEESPQVEKQRFFDTLATTLDKSGSDEMCLFVHGAADPFEDAVADAAELAYYLERPMVIYSWPSVGKLKKYRVDEGNAEWSQEHFDTLCEDLKEFSHHHPIRVILVAHSVGNRLVARAAPVIHGTDYIKDIELVSPDIDAETFKHYVMGYHGHGARARLYFSNRDKVLPFTQMLYGGYYRLGEGVGPVLASMTPHAQSPSQPAVLSGAPTNAETGAASNLSSGVSSNVSTSPAGDAALQGFGRRQRWRQRLGAPGGGGGARRGGLRSGRVLGLKRRFMGRAARLEKIDFTEVDKRVIGHHLPFELVANMILTDKPGEGLVLVPAIAGEGNAFARFAHWRNDLGKIDESHPGFCRRVVKEGQQQESPKRRAASRAKL